MDMKTLKYLSFSPSHDNDQTPFLLVQTPSSLLGGVKSTHVNVLTGIHIFKQNQKHALKITQIANQKSRAQNHAGCKSKITRLHHATRNPTISKSRRKKLRDFISA
jgi:hypothetical protein